MACDPHAQGFHASERVSDKATCPRGVRLASGTCLAPEIPVCEAGSALSLSLSQPQYSRSVAFGFEDPHIYIRQFIPHDARASPVLGVPETGAGAIPAPSAGRRRHLHGAARRHRVVHGASKHQVTAPERHAAGLDLGASLRRRLRDDRGRKEPLGHDGTRSRLLANHRLGPRLVHRGWIHAATAKQQVESHRAGLLRSAVRGFHRGHGSATALA